MIYKVVNAHNLRTLEAKVNISLLDGWELAGPLVAEPVALSESAVWCLSEDGISDTGRTIPSNTNWCQPMVNNKLMPIIGVPAVCVIGDGRSVMEKLADAAEKSVISPERGPEDPDELRNRILEAETLLAAACLSQPGCRLIVKEAILERLRPDNFRLESVMDLSLIHI